MNFENTTKRKAQRDGEAVKLLQIIISVADKTTNLRELVLLCLDEICRYAGWPVGHAYFLESGSDDLLIPSDLWHLDDPNRFELFRQVSMATPLARGEGLPGRILESGACAWIKDVNLDPNFPRNRLAKDLGIKTGFGLPVLIENRVVGVLEFFYQDALEPNPAFLDLMDSIKTQLGQLYRRRQVEVALRAAHDILESQLGEQNTHLVKANQRLLDEMEMRKKAVEELQEREGALRVLMDQLPAMLWTVDAEMRVTSAMGSRLSQTGFDPSPVGKTLFECFHSKDPQHQEIERHRDALDGHCQTFNMEIDHRFLGVHLEPLRGEAGFITGAIGVALDLTDTTTLERELFAQNKILELIAAGNSQQEIFHLLLSSIETLVPGILGSILLLDATGQHVKHCSAPHLPSAYNDAIDGARIGPRAGSCGTAAYLRKRIIVENIETDPLWADYRELALKYGLRACWSQPIFSSEGRVLGTFAMYYRSPRKPSERELRILASAAHMTAVAIEREQMEHNLKSTLADLETSNQELEQFVYIASHDLQEPLRTVILHLQYLEKISKDKITPEEKQFMDTAIKGANRMKNMIQDLLAYARTGRADQSKERVCLSRLAAIARENLRNMIEESEAKITIGDLPTLTVVPSQLVQVFQNLLSNAIKYRSKTPPEIDLSAQKRNTEWLFAVRDNGIGIAPEYRERIFVAFQRLHADQVRYPGTGIGLAICKKIIEHNNGKIWVESIPGKGSAFYFTLRSEEA